MKKTTLKLLALAVAGLGIYVWSGDIDDTQTTTPTVVTVTKVDSLLWTYGADGDVASVTATVTRTRDDGTGAVVVKSGSRTFTRAEALTSTLPKMTNLIENLEKKGVNSARTWFFNQTPLGS